MQTKRDSLIEAAINILIGAIISLLGQLLFFWLEGVKLSWGTNFRMLAFFTVLSLVRSYCLRRLFNKRTIKEHELRMQQGSR